MGIPPGVPPQAPPPYAQSRAQWKAQRAQWKMQAKMQRASYRAQYRMHSRGSLLGPLFLTLIGVFALLMTTHRIDIGNFWQWYGHWWPVILIGAGVLLAVESLAVAGHSRVRLGGGVVLLMLLLAFLGIAAAHNHLQWDWAAARDQMGLGNNLDLSQVFGDKHEVSEQVVHALPPDATLVIRNQHGSVTISSSTGTGDGQMHLALDKRVYSNSDSEAQRRLQSLEPLITANGNVVTVHMPSSDRDTADMNITLPASVAVEVHAAHGDVTVNGRQASVTASADHGDMRLASITGVVRAVMRQGDFSASNIQGDLNLDGHMNDVTLSQITGAATLNGDFFGDVHLENLHGPVHLHSIRTDIQLGQLAGNLSLDGDDLTVDDAAGPITIATHAKNIALRRVNGELKVHNSNGSVEVKSLEPLGAMNIENSNGSVELTLPAVSKFSINATATDGEIHTDFKLATQNNDNHSTVSGSVGSGGPLIRIEAEKGDITLHKGE